MGDDADAEGFEDVGGGAGDGGGGGGGVGAELEEEPDEAGGGGGGGGTDASAYVSEMFDMYPFSASSVVNPLSDFVNFAKSAFIRVCACVRASMCVCACISCSHMCV